MEHLETIENSPTGLLKINNYDWVGHTDLLNDDTSLNKEENDELYKELYDRLTELSQGEKTIREQASNEQKAVVTATFKTIQDEISGVQENLQQISEDNENALKEIEQAKRELMLLEYIKAAENDCANLSFEIKKEFQDIIPTIIDKLNKPDVNKGKLVDDLFQDSQQKIVNLKSKIGKLEEKDLESTIHLKTLEEKLKNKMWQRQEDPKILASYEKKITLIKQEEQKILKQAPDLYPNVREQEIKDKIKRPEKHPNINSAKQEQQKDLVDTANYVINQTNKLLEVKQDQETNLIEKKRDSLVNDIQERFQEIKDELQKLSVKAARRESEKLQRIKVELKEKVMQLQELQDATFKSKEALVKKCNILTGQLQKLHKEQQTLQQSNKELEYIGKTAQHHKSNEVVKVVAATKVKESVRLMQENQSTIIYLQEKLDTTEIVQEMLQTKLTTAQKIIQTLGPDHQEGIKYENTELPKQLIIAKQAGGKENKQNQNIVNLGALGSRSDGVKPIRWASNDVTNFSSIDYVSNFSNDKVYTVAFEVVQSKKITNGLQCLKIDNKISNFIKKLDNELNEAEKKLVKIIEENQTLLDKNYILQKIIKELVWLYKKIYWYRNNGEEYRNRLHIWILMNQSSQSFSLRKLLFPYSNLLLPSSAVFDKE